MNIFAEFLKLSAQPPDNLHPAWRLAGEVKPQVALHDYYGCDHSEPVQVVLNHAGEHSVSTQTWRYSFRKQGWLLSDLPDGLEPRSYAHMGIVTHWCSMQALCV